MSEERNDIRWDKIDPIYEQLIKTIYEQEFTGNEIDILINRLWTKITTDKIITVSYWEIQRMLALDHLSKAPTDDKKPYHIPGIA